MDSPGRCSGAASLLIFSNDALFVLIKGNRPIGGEDGKSVPFQRNLNSYIAGQI